MIAPKHCVLAAAGGFVLSALVGLVRGNFGSLMFLRALVCGLVAGAVCLGIYAVFTLVLGVGTDGGAPGSTLDISVGDEGFFGSDEDATFNLGNLGDGPEQSPQFDEAREAIGLGPSGAADPGMKAEREGTAGDAPIFDAEPPADKPAEAFKPVFTAAPLAAKGPRKAPDLDNMDPTVAARTIQSMLKVEM